MALRAMTAFDWAVIVVAGASMLFAFVRGVTRELIALLAWVLGFIAAVTLSPAVGAMLPEFGGHAAVRYLVAFVGILLAALLLGALIAWPLATFLRRVGLGFVDRFLGAVFGFARGVVLVLAFVLLAGITSLPRQEWWQSSVLAPPLAVLALSLKPWLPVAWAEQLDYSRGGRTLPRAPAERKA
jgi:membrane protein required for colicin V production